MSRSVMPGLYAVSLVFLALAFGHVYCRKKQKSFFDVMTLIMIAMLSCFYAVLLVPLVAGSAHVSQYPVLCQLEGFSIQVSVSQWISTTLLTPSRFLQFFYLSSMFWLNSMCVDVWRTFRRLRSFDGGRRGAPGARSTGSSILTHSKLRWYALWSWGGPGAVVAVTLAMQYLPAAVSTLCVVSFATTANLSKLQIQLECTNESA